MLIVLIYANYVIACIKRPKKRNFQPANMIIAHKLCLANTFMPFAGILILSAVIYTHRTVRVLRIKSSYIFKAMFKAIIVSCNFIPFTGVPGHIKRINSFGAFGYAYSVFRPYNQS